MAPPSRESLSACDLVARKSSGESIGVFLTAPIHRLGIADMEQLMTRAQRSEHGQHVLIMNGELRPEAVPLVHEAVALSISVIVVDDLRRWLETTRRGNATENTRLHEVVARLSYDLVRLIADDPRTLDQVEWRDLERATACAFRACGFSVTLTRPSEGRGPRCHRSISRRRHPPHMPRRNQTLGEWKTRGRTSSPEIRRRPRQGKACVRVAAIDFRICWKRVRGAIALRTATALRADFASGGRTRESGYAVQDCAARRVRTLVALEGACPETGRKYRGGASARGAVASGR